MRGLKRAVCRKAAGFRDAINKNPQPYGMWLASFSTLDRARDLREDRSLTNGDTTRQRPRQ